MPNDETQDNTLFKVHDIIIVETAPGGQLQAQVLFFVGLDGHLLYTYGPDKTAKVFNTMSFGFNQFRQPTEDERKVIARNAEQ